MKIPEMFKRKDFFLGLLMGLIIMAIASVVIVWTIAQHVNLITTTDKLEESQSVAETEDVGIVSEIINLIKKDKDVKFLGMKIQGEMSLKPTLVFNFSGEMQKIMGQKSEDELIEFSPAAKGRFHWSNPSTLVFTVSEPLLEYTTYTATLNQKTIETLGVEIKGEKSANFSTEGPKAAQLVGMNPNEEVDPKTNLTFTFSEDVADLSQIGQNYKNGMIKFDPPVVGSYRWVNLRQLRFLPEVPLQPATKYKATIKPDIITGKAYYLPSEQVTEFNTAMFEVISSKIQLLKTTNTTAELNARLVFNYPVNPDDLQKYVHLYTLKDSGEKELQFFIKPFQTSDSFELITLYPEIVKEDQEIKLVVSKGLLCENGSVGLKNDYVTTAHLSPLDPIKVYNIYGNSDYSMGNITIEFSRAVEKESAEAFISISPEVPYKLEVYKDIVRLKSENFKPEEIYKVVVKSGLPAEDAAPLETTFAREVRMPGLSPMVRFNSRGYYLSNKGNMNLGLETVNLNKVDVSIYKVYANNIVHFLADGGYGSIEGRFGSLGSLVQNFTLELNNQQNQLVETPIPLSEYMDGERKGIYQVVVHDRDNYWLRDSRIVIATDIGMVTKLAANELAVWVNSLKSLEPLSNAQVTLLSSNNQVLIQGETNRQGLIRFEDLNKVFQDFEPYLIIVEYEGDFSFLKLSDGILDMTDFDTSGKSFLTEGYEAFMYSDRGVYRPGDKAYLTALVRGVNVALPPEFPVRLKILDPMGGLYREFVKNTGNGGAAEFEVNLPDYVKTGKYKVDLYVADKSIGTASFSVEEFMPDRMKVQVDTDQKSYGIGDTAQIKVSGINLFGPPASGRNVELSVKLDSVPFSTPAYRSYTFGDSSIKTSPINEIVGNGKLDENGEYLFDYSFDAGQQAGNMMKVVFAATVTEEGGRAVTSYGISDYYPYDSYIGLKRLGEYYGKIDEPYQIQYVEVNPQGELLSGSSLVAKVYRVLWHSIWQRDGNGNWYYDSDEELEEVLTQELTPGFGEQTFSFTPRDFGQYKVVVINPETNAHSSIDFYATGWGYSPWAMTNPTKIELDLDKKSYENGELAQIQVKAPFSGKALVTIEREKIYDMQVVEFKENTGLLAVNVKEDWKPNVYVTVQMIRSIDSGEEHAPIRAFGTIPLPVTCASSKLDIDIKSQDEMRPKETVEVNITVAGATENAYVTLAAVDEGILQLTGFNTPDPYNFFYGKKKLDVRSYDLYNMILPEVEQAGKKSSPGGDADKYMEGIQKENLNPISVKRVKPVSLWSGIVKLNEKGEATVSLDLPQFNGTLRLMAVAFAGNKMGSTDKKVIVRDPIVLTSTYPRFISGTDKFQIPVSVFNGTNEDGEFSLNLKIDGPVNLLSDAQQDILLKKDEEKVVFFDCKAENAVDNVTFKLEVSGNGYSSSEETELALRPAAPLVTEFLNGNFTAEKPVELILPSDWVKGTEEYSLTISPFPAIQFTGSLQYLLNYPYGCAEQTTSRLFPLLYFDELVEKVEPDLFSEGSAEYYIREGILKLQSMQLPAGDFAYWPGGSYSNQWTSIYVSHFLVEARKAGYEVANYTYNKMLEYVKSVARKSAFQTWELQTKIYSLYVLALAEKADLSNMAYVKNHQWDKLGDDSRVMLAAAYYYAGERSEAKKLIPFSFTKPKIERETGRNFNSSIRHDAIILSVLADVDPGHPTVPSLIQRLTSETTIGRWGTTQENAFAFMAIGKMLKVRSNDDYTGVVLINDNKVGSFNNREGLVIKDSRLAEGKIKISLVGTGECYYFAEVKGIPISGEIKPYDNGITVRREYLNKEGKPINVKEIKQGELVIAKITITAHKNELNNLVIVDMLPAGLEIENPRLQSRANIDWVKEESFVVDYLDMRDDRLLIFTNLYTTHKPMTFYYALRAVTVGDFVLPPIKAECMYEPEIFSISEKGVLKVVK